jgi:cell wall-associated NlpC family hydrolase
MPRLDEAARRYLGVPFKHQGRDPAVGIDCVGLGQLACRDCGVAVPDWTDYARHPHAGLLESRLRAVFGPPHSDMQPGDIVAMRFAGDRGPVRHVGIVGEHPHGLSLIHTDSRLGRVVEHRIDDHWRARIAGVYRRAV